jgi:hypothetical protein
MHRLIVLESIREVESEDLVSEICRLEMRGRKVFFWEEFCDSLLRFFEVKKENYERALKFQKRSFFSCKLL